MLNILPRTSYSDPQKTPEQLSTLGIEYYEKGEYGRAAECFKQRQIEETALLNIYWVCVTSMVLV